MLKNKVSVRYMSGDSFDLEECITVNDIKVQVANKHEKFAPEISVLSTQECEQLNDDEVAPPIVVIILQDMTYDGPSWEYAVRAHAKAGDQQGVVRAMSAISADPPTELLATSGEEYAGDVLIEQLKDQSVVFAERSEEKRLVDTLVRARADVNRAGDLHGQTSGLLLAAYNNRTDLMEMLLQSGAAVNSAERLGCTSLSLACARGHRSFVELLLQAGADVHFRNKDGRTGLLIACHGGHVDVVDSLLRARADVHDTDHDGYSGLIFAAENGNLELVQKLVGRGANVNQCANFGQTALFCSAGSDHVEVTTFLLSTKASVNHIVGCGETSLTWACRGDSPETVKLLIEARSNVNHANPCKETGLLWAAKNGRVEVTKILLEARADVNCVDGNKNTCLYWACRNGNKEVEKLLVEAGSRYEKKYITVLKAGFLLTPMIALCIYIFVEFVCGGWT